MSIFIFLFLLLASLMCCTSAEENRNNEEMVYRKLQTSKHIPVFRKKRNTNDDGRETEQNPKDPKYKEMAKEIVHHHLRIKKEDARKIIVTKVTTQIVSGIKYKIQFKVVLKSGKTVSCDSETWEQSWQSDKKITYKCSDTSQNPDENNGGTEHKYTQPKDVDQALYRRYAKESVKNYINHLSGNIEIVDINTKNNEFALTHTLRQLIYYVNMDVIVRGSNNFICSVVFVLPNTDPLNTKCTEKQIPGGNKWADPSKKKYLDLAEKSLLNRQGQELGLTLGTSGHDAIVTYVTRQVFKGFKDSIDFIVGPVNGEDYECQTRVWEKSTGRAVIEEVNCHMRKDEQEDIKPPFTPDRPNEDDNEFYKQAKESVKDYLNKKQLVIVDTNIKSTGFVTTPLHQQKIMYVNLDVTITQFSNYICSVVFVLPNTIPLSTECVENRNTPDGNHWADPSINNYLALAEKSLELKQEHIFASKHDTIVTFVVRKVVSGLKYTIGFIVRLIDDHEYECHSHVMENFKGQVNIEEVICDSRGSIPPEPKPNDPNEQIYRELGKAYIRINIPATLEIIETKVINIAYVATSVHQQQILYINYDVAVRPSSNYICSVLFELPSHIPLSTKCIEKPNRTGGIQWDDPSKQTYLNIAEQSLLQNKTLAYEIGTSRYDTIVTFVVQQVVSGHKDTIDFIIRSEDGREYECHSLVWEKTTGRVVTESVNCHLRGANPPEPKPDDLVPPHYKEIYSGIAIDIIKQYIIQLPGRFDIVKAKIRNIAIVETLVHQQQILYINYDVAVRPSSNYICSVLFVIPSNNSISSNCVEDRGIAGGYYWVDPSKKEYLDLAEQWLLVNNNGVSRHDTIITFVVQQAVSGYKNTLDFIVLPEAGHVYKCQSHVWQSITGVVVEDGKCNTQLTPSDPGGQELDYPEYIKLGSSSILIYFRNLPGKLEVMETKIQNIASVKTHVNGQQILYLNYDVVVRGSRNYICSVLFELPSNISLSTQCIEKQNTPGGGQWVDPSIPKYLNIAIQSLLKNITLVKEIGASRYNPIVTFVVQQVVSGYKDTIDFIIRSEDGREYECHSLVWEKTTGRVVTESVNCHLRGANPPEPKPDDLVPPHYKEIYSGIAIDIIKQYITQLPGRFYIVEAKIRNIAIVETLVHQQQILYMNYDVAVRPSSNYICSVLFVIPSNNSISSNCVEDRGIAGGYYWVDPSKKEYLDLAEQWLLVNNNGVSRHDTIITFVVQQAVSGYKNTLDFIVLPEAGHEYKCQSHVWQTITGVVLENGKCDTQLTPGDPDKQDFDYSKYFELGSSSVITYINNLPGKPDDVETNIINIAIVTPPVYPQKILYMNFNVVVKGSNNYICSVLFELPNHDPLSTNCIENKNTPGGEAWADPSQLKYYEIAVESLSQDKSLLYEIGTSRYTTIVTFVVQQVVSGYKDSIDFIVRSTNGRQYECRSDVWEKETGKIVIERVSCHPLGSNPPKPKPNDVNEQIYPELGRSYIRIHIPQNLEIIETRVINIAYVTAPVHRQRIMYINYEVIVRNSNKYICSVLFVIPTHNSLSTKCIEIQNTPGGIQWEDPSKPIYLDFAEKSILQKELADKLSAGSYDTIVTFVIKLVSGYKNTIDFIIRSIDGREYECRSNVSEKRSGRAIIEDVTCKPRGQGELEPRDPYQEIYKDYHESGKSSLQIYFTPGNFVIMAAKIINIVNVTTRHGQQILYINYDVMVKDSNDYICTVVFVLPSHNSLSTNCIENWGTPGGLYWVDPSKTEYLDLAEKSLLLQTDGQTSHTSCVSEHDIIVTFVVQQVVSGRNDRLDFIVQPRYGQEYECHSNVWEPYIGQAIIDDLNCNRRKNQETDLVVLSKKVQKPVRQEIQNIEKTKNKKKIVREHRSKKRTNRHRG